MRTACSALPSRFGAAFPVLKMVEWLPKISAGMTPGENLFFMYYYVMTGLHLCHVLLGLAIMGFVMRDLRVSKELSQATQHQVCRNRRDVLAHGRPALARPVCTVLSHEVDHDGIST